MNEARRAAMLKAGVTPSTQPSKDSTAEATFFLSWSRRQVPITSASRLLQKSTFSGEECSHEDEEAVSIAKDFKVTL